MGFEKFGKTGYVSQTKIAALVSFLEKGEIPGTRCTRCKRLYFPPRADCLDCRNSSIEWVPLDGACKLVTFTEVYFAPPFFQAETPYVLGVAQMKDGLRVFAPLDTKVDPKTLKPGLEMVLRVTKRGVEGLFYQLEKSA